MCCAVGRTTRTLWRWPTWAHVRQPPVPLSSCSSSMALFLAALCSSSSACVWRSGAQDGLHPDGQAHGGGCGGRCVALDAAVLPGELCRRLAAGLRRALPEQLPGALPCPVGGEAHAQMLSSSDAYELEMDQAAFLLTCCAASVCQADLDGDGRRGAAAADDGSGAGGGGKAGGTLSSAFAHALAPHCCRLSVTVRVCGCQVAIELRGS